MLPQDEIKALRLWLWVQYRSPYELITNWLWRVNKPHDDDGNPLDPRHLVKDNSLRDRFATFFERRDYRWRNHYATRNTVPSKRWKRP